MFIPVALQLAFAASAMIQPTSVPARGEQEAILTLDRAGMVRLSAGAGAGTHCAVVDHLRGPFAAGGEVGVKDCDLDLLLDAGTYKLRLTSPRNGKGTAALRAAAFQELNAAPVRLEPGRAVEQQLRSGQQASFWVHLDARRAVALRASGRTAGQVQLWRSGAWREELAARDLAAAPRPTQPIHEWWIEQTLEAGDYLFTVYGTDPRRWTEGTESDLLSVQLGFVSLGGGAQKAPPAPPLAPGQAATPPPTLATGSFSATLPAWGLAAFEVPAGALTAILSASPGGAATRMIVAPTVTGGSQRSCTVEPRAVVPECVVSAPAEGEKHVVLVRGAPGTAIDVRWAPRGSSPRLVDGEYRENRDAVPIEALESGEYLLGLRDVSPDRDAAPLGCALVRELNEGRRETVATDFPPVGPARPLNRAFNTEGDEVLWFEVVAPGIYHVATDPKRKERCELYRLEAGGTTRVSRTTEDPVCDLRQPLGKGRYELRISGGGRGIDRILVSAEGAASLPDSPARTACAVRARIDGNERYTLLASRTGAAAMRGLVARKLPLSLTEPLPLELRAGETLRLPLSVNGTVRVHPVAGKPTACALKQGGAGAWRDGSCWLSPKGADELTLTAPDDAPASVWIDRPAPARALPPLEAFTPAPSPIPALPAGAPAFFDLDRGEARSFTFQVARPGLYHVRTEGLLATACALRTPTVARLAADTSGGRGRNCLVETYLDPGTYLVTAQAQGPSRGRASILLEHRPAVDRGRVGQDGEVFFRAPAGEMARQRLSVGAAGTYDLATTALGARLACRLEDADGWPLVAVPSSCAQHLSLKKGEYLWTQLPLTVESMRHTQLAPVRPAVVLRGAKPHPVELWTTYAVEQSDKGRDEFTFTLEADLEIFVQLGGGMQGRILREGEKDAIELVPPQETGEAPPAVAPTAEGEEGGEAGEGGEEYVPPPPPAEACEECRDHPADETAEEPSAAPPRPAPQLTPVTPERPAGHAVTLPAGRYRLVAEHSHGDVGVSYSLRIAAEVMTPGMARDLPVPSKLTVRVPRAGTLRLRTRGEADVRCRLFDPAGQLVAESGELGDDWNCGFAHPLTAGDYTLVLESETQLAGTTRLALSAPETADAGTIEGGKKYTVGDKLVSAALPAPAADVVQVTLTSKDAFSCAVEDEAGAVVLARAEVRACPVLLHPLGHAYRLRLWSLERPAEIAAAVQLRPVAPLSGGRVPAAGAAQADLPRAGRYRTGAGVQCAPAAAPGPLVPCAPEVSLEAGPAVFSGLGDDAAPLALEEITAALDAAKPERLPLGRRPFVQRQRSDEKAVHLLEVRAAPGERAAPACALEGGVQSAGTGSSPACFAASSPTAVSTARLFALTDPAIEATVTRLAVPLPAAARLDAGLRTLAPAAPASRWTLPAGPSRLALVLPPATWAVLLAGDRAVDLCPPSEGLATCTFTAQGGELLLYAPRERRAQVELTTLPAMPRELVLGAAPLEARPAPGKLLVRAPAADAPRSLEITGARRCAIRLGDGARLDACAATLPARTAAELQLDVDGPVRILARELLGLRPRSVGGQSPPPPAQDEQAAPSGAGPAATFGLPLPATAPATLRAGEATPLSGALVERSFTLREPAVVHLRADRGVCALAADAAVEAVDGLGKGCAIDRLLTAGTHRLAVRPFADEPLSGAVRFTTEPLETLAEGVGPERWLGPDERRLFQFTTASRGKIGIGVQQDAEVLGCTVLDAAQRPVATGCQALLELDQGSYLLAVHAPAGDRPARFRPVVLGLAGARTAVPAEYLQDLFQRIGVKP